MNLALFIARRYFLSKKKKNFINVISIISMLVLALGTMALIIVLSIFNGLEGLLRSLHSTVDPDLVITASENKTFQYSEDLRDSILSEPGILGITEVMEDNALLKYNNAQRVGRIKGVSEYFLTDDRFRNSIVSGDFELESEGVMYAIVGQGVQYDLNISTLNEFTALQVYYPDSQIGPNSLNPERLYRVKSIVPGAVFAVEKNYDENLVIVPVAFTEELFGKPGRRTSLELKLASGYTPGMVQARLESLLSTAYSVKTNEDLHSDLYTILRIEKLFVFIIFSVIIAIASINIYFALTMLTIDKRKDIAVLASMGASERLIRRIFLAEGTIVAFTGAFTGLIFGLLVCYAQIYFGFITTGTQTTIMQAYPVEVLPSDIAFTALSIVIITLLATVRPAYLASKNIALEILH